MTGRRKGAARCRERSEGGYLLPVGAGILIFRRPFESKGDESLWDWFLDDRSVTPFIPGPPALHAFLKSPDPPAVPGVVVENGMNGTTGLSPALSPSHFASFFISEKNGSTFSVIVRRSPRWKPRGSARMRVCR